MVKTDTKKRVSTLSKKKYIPTPILELCRQADLTFEELEKLNAALDRTLERLDEEDTELFLTNELLEKNWKQAQIDYKGDVDTIINLSSQYHGQSISIANLKAIISEDRQMLVKVSQRVKEIIK